MSERVPPDLRSTQPLSSKRPRAEDSGPSSGLSGCGYGRCRRFGWGENGKGPYYPFCSVWHQNFHMADQYEKYRDGGSHVTEQPRGVCMLPRCNLPVLVIDSTTEEAFDFCREGHVDEYIQAVSEQWGLEGRVCKLDGCRNHVRVVETSKKIRDHCCPDHRFEAAAARGSQAAEERKKVVASVAANGVSSAPLGAPVVQSAETDVGNAPTSGDDIREISVPQGDPRQDRQAIEPERGYQSGDFDEDILNCLKSFYVKPSDISKADPNRLFCRMEKVTDFEPLDNVEGCVPRFFLHESRSQGLNSRKTRSGNRWKQSSNSHGKKSIDERIETKYFSYYRQDDLYIVNQGTPEGLDEVWRLHEYSLHNDYAEELTGGKLPVKKPVISKIFKEKKGRRGKLPVKKPVKSKIFKEKKGRRISKRRKRSPPLLEVEIGGKDLSGEENNALHEGLASGGGLQLTNSNESDDFAFQDCPMELMANRPEGAFGGVIAEEGGMSSSLSSNVSLGQGPGRVTLQGPSCYETAEGDGSADFQQDGFMISNVSSAPVHVGTLAEGTGLTSCISSSAASGDGLPSGEETLQGGSSNGSGEQVTNSNESDDFSFQDCPMELMANRPEGAFGGVIAKEGGMSSSLSSNVSPGQGPGRDLQGPSCYETAEGDGSADFQLDGLMISNVSSAPVLVGTLAEGTGLTSCISSSAASGDGLPSGEETLQGSSSNRCGEFANSDFVDSLMNLNYLFEESWCMDSNFAPIYEGEEVT